MIDLNSFRPLAGHWSGREEHWRGIGDLALTSPVRYTRGSTLGHLGGPYMHERPLWAGRRAVAEGSFLCTGASPQWVSGGLLVDWGGTGEAMGTWGRVGRDARGS